MDGLQELEDTLKRDLGDSVNSLRLEIIAKCSDIDVDESEFSNRLTRVYDSAQEQSVSLMKGLTRARKELFSKDLACTLPPRIDFIGDPVRLDLGQAEKKMRLFVDHVGTVREELLALETNTQSNALQLIDRFEDNYSAMMTSLTELLQEFFQKAMNFANKFYESLKELAVTTITAHLEEHGDMSPSFDLMADGADEGLDAPAVDSYLLLLSNVDAMMEVFHVYLVYGHPYLT